MISLKKILRQIYPYSIGLVEQIVISSRTFSKKSSILIYQMGKVGSSTIEKSLKSAAIKEPVYHIHFLSNEGINFAEQYYRELNCGLPRHLIRSKMLREAITSSSGNSWKIITLVREPIGRTISNLFQNVQDAHPQFINKNGTLKITQVTDYLIQCFNDFNEADDFTCSWLDKEVNKVFRIDTYSYPFDQNKGYSIIQKNNIEILILRMEDMNNNFNEALSRFLNISKPIIMEKANIGKKKKYSNDYKSVVGNIKISDQICDKIYQSKYVQHFYSSEMIDSFFKKWS